MSTFMSYNEQGESMRCTALHHESYSVARHIAALFAILAGSFLGTVLPILGKRGDRFRVPDYVYAVGKSIATGVVLGVAVIHMLEPANASLTSECLPDAIRNLSNPLAYMICLAAVAAMHSLEACLRTFFENRTASNFARVESDENEHLLSCSDIGHHHHPVIYVDDPETTSGVNLLSAVFLELGVSLHSVFVGLTVGVCADAELYTLVCALCFHQFFEGVALGSRLVEASLTPKTEYVFSAVFVLSAPFGAAIGVMIVCEQLVNTNGSSYLLTQGLLDAVCAGILLYLGFQLLVSDFYSDLRAHSRGVRFPRLFLTAMLLGLWSGLVIMALIGQYL
ncbi:putative cation transporter [Leptomonas pyrrhocoris]|uniref:Putative cation transporter n=1 Tax=Leptomonas pyrrhocoris TaxID=157538 RepID=A0A0M9G7Y4_LEPPY|nr:putative cation transporter [Leptomonas pyrrhocoris]KPA84447.1 putative cation transporter [Leptomonas pyrrhocoris]|eukprot:XP_015662886.1 putative cation transporter [Leptomonas pyrrhocoris]